jgi:preprotein translocase subunit SecB
MAEPQEELRRAARVGTIANLIDIRLRSMSFELLAFDAKPPFTPTGEWSINWDRQDGAVLVYEVGLHLEAADTASAKVFRTGIAFALGYSVPADVEISSEEAEAYGSLSAKFMAHPYFRELVHTLSLRAGLPGLVLDVIRSPLELVRKE